jgi:hypothetical protein
VINEVDVTIGVARLVVTPRTGMPHWDVLDITKAVVAVCRALGTEQGDDLAAHMWREIKAQSAS